MASPSRGGANGEASKGAQSVLADARNATEKARTAHVAGSVTQNGSTVSFNLVVGHGQGGGTLSENGATFDIVLHQPKVYLKAGKATWTKVANSAAASLFADKWLETTTANKDFVNLANLADIVKLTKALEPSGTLTKQGATSFRGQPVVPLFDSGGGGGTLYVASRGIPYIVAVVGGKGAPGRLLFTQYNTAKVPPAPQGAINLNQLENGAGNSSGA